MQFRVIQILSLLMFISIGIVAQSPKEINPIILSDSYQVVIDKLEDMTEQNYSQVINEVLEIDLKKMNNPIERFNIYLWGLCFESARLEKYDLLMDFLKQAQSEGLYFPFTIGERRWPDFVKELEKSESFNEWYDRNNALKKADQEKSVAEYFVKLPENYDGNEEYPLILTLTGGFGSHVQLSQHWKSKTMSEKFITVYTQGSVCQGSFLKSYARGSYNEITSIFQSVIKKYNVDTTQVILAGQSAGGYRSLVIAFDEILPAKGLLLAFPVKPRELDEEKIRRAAERGLKAAMICGENDFSYLKGQKELAYLLDKNNLKNRFLIYPELGHWFPEDFEKQIDISLEFLFNK